MLTILEEVEKGVLIEFLLFFGTWILMMKSPEEQSGLTQPERNLFIFISLHTVVFGALFLDQSSMVI